METKYHDCNHNIYRINRVCKRALPAANFIRVDPDGQLAREVHVFVLDAASDGRLLQHWLPSGDPVDPDAPVSLALVRVLGEPVILETLFEGFPESLLEVLELVRVTVGGLL